MKLQPLNLNPFAQGIKDELTAWWNAFGGDFIGQTIQLTKDSSFPLLQKEYAVSQGKLPHDTNVNIPYLEVTPLYTKAQHGALFVNCNPSGTDYSYYRTYNQNNDCCFYYGEFNPNNPYFQESEKFAQEVGAQSFAMIDVFPLVMQNQAVLKKAFYDAMFKDPYLNALRCVFGYAITCHKSQGGEWDEVYVHVPRNITLNPTKETYQWVYTSMTRARQTLHMINDFYIK